MCVRSALFGSSGLGSANATTVCPLSNRALAGMSPSSLTGIPQEEWVTTPTGTVGQMWCTFGVSYGSLLWLHHAHNTHAMMTGRVGGLVTTQLYRLIDVMQSVAGIDTDTDACHRL